MSRIATTFESLQRDGRKALIPFITAGDPHADSTVEIMWAMADAGADVIELGVPFSDRWRVASAWPRCWVTCGAFVNATRPRRWC